MADTEREITTATADLASSEQTLEDALTVAGNCHRHYEAAPDYIKRQINQGFFTRLIINTDGTVERAELTEPFAQLLIRGQQTTPIQAQTAPDAPDGASASRTPAQTPPVPKDAPGHWAACSRAEKRKTPIMILSGLVRIRQVWWS